MSIRALHTQPVACTVCATYGTGTNRFIASLHRYVRSFTNANPAATHNFVMHAGFLVQANYECRQAADEPRITPPDVLLRSTSDEMPSCASVSQTGVPEKGVVDSGHIFAWHTHRWWLQVGCARVGRAVGAARARDRKLRHIPEWRQASLQRHATALPSVHGTPPCAPSPCPLANRAASQRARCVWVVPKGWRVAAL